MVFVVLLFLFVAGLFMVAIMHLGICPHYFDAKACVDNKIDFDSVKKFYPINPDKWVLADGYVMYNRIKCFRFNFIDYWRYRSWRKQQKRMQKTIEQNDALAAVIKDVKNDIAKFEAENEAYIQSKLDELRL